MRNWKQKLPDFPSTELIKGEMQQAKGFAKEFQEFITRGNVIDLAVGVIIGAAFGKIVDSIVKDVIMPPISILTGKVDFSSMYVNLSDRTFATLAEAEAAGVPVIKYGLFINNVISFLIVALVIFLLIKQVNKLYRKEEKEDKVDEPARPYCPFCFEDVHEQATRCPHCTSELPG